VEGNSAQVLSRPEFLNLTADLNDSGIADLLKHTPTEKRNLGFK